MDYIIREMLPQEYGLLYNFLYEAIFIPESVEEPEIVKIKFKEVKYDNS